MGLQKSKATAEASDDHNPYRAPETLYEPAIEQLDRHPLWFRFAIFFQLLTIAVGVVLAVFDIETILGTGPILALLGLVVFLQTKRQDGSRRPLSLVFGVSGPMVAVICFLLIFCLEWSPRAAHFPIGAIAVCYSLLFLPMGMYVLRSYLRSHAAADADRTNEGNSDVAEATWV